MFKFLKEVVAGSGSGLKDFPYTIGEPYASAWGSWTHHRGTSKVCRPHPSPSTPDRSESDPNRTWRIRFVGWNCSVYLWLRWSTSSWNNHCAMLARILACLRVLWPRAL
jgi:hypothetical protein